MVLFDHNQPISEAMHLTGDIVLELLQSKLDEGLSSLEDGKDRLARKQIDVVLKHGSWKEFNKQMRKGDQDASAILSENAKVGGNRTTGGYQEVANGASKSA